MRFHRKFAKITGYNDGGTATLVGHATEMLCILSVSVQMNKFNNIRWQRAYIRTTN